MTFEAHQLEAQIMLLQRQTRIEVANGRPTPRSDCAMSLRVSFDAGS